MARYEDFRSFFPQPFSSNFDVPVANEARESLPLYQQNTFSLIGRRARVSSSRGVSIRYRSM
jgi:hypothetical protein